MSKDSITQIDLIKEFFMNNPNRDIHHNESAKWLEAEYKKLTGKDSNDSRRAIRTLHDKGFLIKIIRGVYKYDPNSVHTRELENFTSKQKEQIKERDGYKCVICGASEREGIELHVDHSKPKELGGKATIENGQTLCAKHNYQKKTFGQTEMGKKMFIRLYDLAKSEGDNTTATFCEDILSIYKKHNIDEHIEWDKNNK